MDGAVGPAAARRGAASGVAFAFAALGVAAIVAKIVIDGARSSDDCDTGLTGLFHWLIMAAAGLSIAAVLVGLFALITHRGSKAIALTAIVCGAVVAALVLMPEGLGSYTCGEGAA